MTTTFPRAANALDALARFVEVHEDAAAGPGEKGEESRADEGRVPFVRNHVVHRPEEAPASSGEPECGHEHPREQAIDDAACAG